jgi:hypothetical protein
VNEYDIFVPLNYNDGSPIEPARFDSLERRLLEFFDGLTFFPQEIILQDDPKAPEAHKTPQARKPGDLLEDLVPSFEAFIKDSGAAALRDAKANMPLKEREFRKP